MPDIKLTHYIIMPLQAPNTRSALVFLDHVRDALVNSDTLHPENARRIFVAHGTPALSDLIEENRIQMEFEFNVPLRN